jgi:DNA-binding CsgD family transcriptional regulator
MNAPSVGPGFLSVLSAGSEDDFRRQLLRFAQGLGFPFVSAMTVLDRSLTESDFISVDNTPAGFHQTFNDLNVGRRDPVMQHCRKGTLPIIWDQQTYVSHGVGELWEAQAAFGYRHGVAMAMHFPDGRHFMLGVDRPEPLPADEQEINRMVADIQLFAVYAQEAAMRLFVPKAHQPERPHLTPRELETLRWTMEGKTAWEVGAILSITERTAVLHLHNAMRKLGAINKHQAVLKALRLGLIH